VKEETKTKHTTLTDQKYEEKIQKSLFIGNLRHVESSETAKQFIQETNKLHVQASHNCPAYILGKYGETTFCSDNQEPSGTAGKPILNALKKHNLTNVVIVVTRYYGGVKLGVRGLIDAYGGVAENTILTGEKTPVIDYIKYQCTMPYDYYNIFSHEIKLPDVVILNTEYTDKIIATLQTSEDTEKNLLSALNKLANNQKLNYNKIQHDK